MPDWIRGVNIGGWLVLERFITPYLFAITDCHVQGNFCYYPDQIDAPPNHDNYCDLFKCKPHRFESVTGQLDYPVDEFTLLESFATPQIAQEYLDIHYDHFVTRNDVALLSANGVTHVRVPLGHWILGDSTSKDGSTKNLSPFVQAHGWLYFVRFVGWCREHHIQVWPDLHTAPGSQNGFDNSGELLHGDPTCHNWSADPTHVNATLSTILRIAAQIKEDGLEDVVTGIGLLNEPFGDCDRTVVRRYNDLALRGVREVLGPSVHVYIGDMFNATKWNDGYWEDEENTFLDSHYYHVFAEEPRALSPRQHIAYVCRKNQRDTVACCYDQANATTSQPSTVPAKGISRIIGEWSAAFDTLVSAKLDTVMSSIADHQVALDMDRVLSPQRRDFLKNFVRSQMVTYEAAPVGVSRGWFFWTLKMEGGAFAEWDFMRGLREGWIPPIPTPNVSSVDLYGTCEDILLNTSDDTSILNIFPDPSTLPKHVKNWQGVNIDDDLVVSHGYSLTGDIPLTTVPPTTSAPTTETDTNPSTGATTNEVTKSAIAVDSTPPPAVEVPASEEVRTQSHPSMWFPIVAIMFFAIAIKMVFFRQSRHPWEKGRGEYETVGSPLQRSVHMTV